MKACTFYALRQLLRKPKELFTLILVSVGIMTALLLLALMLESQWRGRVFPESEENYHFQLYDLTPEEREYVESLPYVFYVKYKHIDDNCGEDQILTCVRVYHEQSAVSLKYARELMDRFDLWSRPHYAKVPYYIILRDRIANTMYYMLTATPYILYPDTQLILNLFSLFLSAAATLIFQERYKRCYAEFGTLRSLGMTDRDIYKINLLQTAAVQLCALLPASLAVVGFGKVYAKISETLDTMDSQIYLDLLKHIPFANIIYIFIISTLAAAAGTFIVCHSERNRTLMELLGGQKSGAVSFVQKTSSAFERARSAHIYNLLHLVRTRSQALRNMLAVTIMLPLPLFFVCLYSEGITDKNTKHLLTASYIGAITALLIIADFVLAFTVSAYFIRGRKREFAILRSLGTPVGELALFALPDAAIKYLLSAFAASLSMFYIYTKYFYSMNYHPDMYGQWVATMFFIIKPLLAASVIAALLPGILGAAAALVGSAGRNIIKHLRETE